MIGRMSLDILTHTSANDVAERINPMDDYGLLLVKYSAPPPEVRLYRVQVEGRNGSVDMTEWAGSVFYNDRQINVTLRDMRGEAWDFINRIHGRRVRLYFESNMPDWYYQGRCDNISTAMQNGVMDISMTFTCHPFRYPILTPSAWADKYRPGASGAAYGGVREESMTVRDQMIYTANFTLHQAVNSNARVIVSGLTGASGAECIITINGTEYPVTEDGVVDIDEPITPGLNTYSYSVSGNGQVVQFTMRVEDKVI